MNNSDAKDLQGDVVEMVVLFTTCCIWSTCYLPLRGRKCMKRERRERRKCVIKITSDIISINLVTRKHHTLHISCAIDPTSSLLFRLCFFSMKPLWSLWPNLNTLMAIVSAQSFIFPDHVTWVQFLKEQGTQTIKFREQKFQASDTLWSSHVSRTMAPT